MQRQGKSLCVIGFRAKYLCFMKHAQPLFFGSFFCIINKIDFGLRETFSWYETLIDINFKKITFNDYLLV